MKPSFSIEVKVGLFVAVALFIIAYITIEVSDLSLTPGRTYYVYAVMDNAEGVTPKTPVQVAGIPVGSVDSIELMGNRRAKVRLRIQRGVQLARNVEVQVRSRGVLGDTYLEIIPGDDQAGLLQKGDYIDRVKSRQDYQDLFGDVQRVTKNVEDITLALKEYTVSDKSHTAQILQNMETLTSNMAKFSSNNVNNMDAIVTNLRALTQDLRSLSKNSSGEIEVAINRISELTEKISKGEGTLGRLINDPSTAEKANEVLDNISDLTKSYSGMRTELGYHMEYLGSEGSVKNYVSFKLQPKPDKFFLIEVVNDPKPPASTKNEITTVTANGTTSVIATETQNFNKIRFSAELGKKFGDFTLRGGLIESTGGVGVDYQKGPITASFQAFDFTADRPQLKFLTQLNITPSIYVLGGLDDMISRQHGLNWVMGAGIKLTDEDVKSLIGGAASFAR